MKVAIIFVLFFATVLCRPARKFFSSSSESSEEAVRPARPARFNMKDVLDSATEIIQAALDSAPADSPDEASDPDTASVDPAARTDSDDTDEDETEESDEDKEEDDTSDSDESADSGESSSMAPPTSSPVTVEPTQEPLLPTVGIDEGRGDSLGGGYYYGGGENPSDYKKTGIYHDDYSVHKVPSPYKSYETLGMAEGKKMAAYGGADGNEVEKTPKVYKALQVHTDFLEEDTSTPEVDTQGLDTSFGTSLDQEHRQASFPGEEEQVPDEEEGEGEEEGEEDESSSPSDATESASESASASMEGDEEESQSSEETKDTPGAADSDSDESEEGDSAESEESNEGVVVDPEVVSDVPVVIAAK